MSENFQKGTLIAVIFVLGMYASSQTLWTLLAGLGFLGVLASRKGTQEYLKGLPSAIRKRFGRSSPAPAVASTPATTPPPQEGIVLQGKRFLPPETPASASASAQTPASCPRCHKQAASLEQSFCGHCGQKLGSICPKCHGTVDTGQKFCAHCGRNLLRPPVPRRTLVARLLVGWWFLSELIGGAIGGEDGALASLLVFGSIAMAVVLLNGSLNRLARRQAAVTRRSHPRARMDS